MEKKLRDIYAKLLKSFGPQSWWPADSVFEVMVGAILTQNTSWQNVERAIANLKAGRCLTFKRLAAVKEGELARLIRPAGYFNVKAKRLKNFLTYLGKNYRGNLRAMAQRDTLALREELLCVNGIGEETADSILLYAFNKPVFVVDAYTKRIFSRHGFVGEAADYAAVQRLFMERLEHEPRLFNEYHALLVRLGKDFCRKSNERCGECPIRKVRR